MTLWEWPLSVLVAAVVSLLGCGTDEPTTSEPPAPPPAQLLDAELVWFDPDGKDERMPEPAPGRILDAAELSAFERRYVDGQPELGQAPSDALAEGKVLVGGVVSSGCFSAERAELGLVAGDVRLIPIGLPVEDPELACVRAVNSVALLAIDPAELPPDVTVQGS